MNNIDGSKNIKSVSKWYKYSISQYIILFIRNLIQLSSYWLRFLILEWQFFQILKSREYCSLRILYKNERRLNFYFSICTTPWEEVELWNYYIRKLTIYMKTMIQQNIENNFVLFIFWDNQYWIWSIYRLLVKRE